MIIICKCNERIPVCLSVLSIFFVICPTILFFSLLYWNEHLQAKYRFNKVSGLLQWDGWCLYWHILIWIILIIYFCFIDYAKAFDCVNHNKLWKILKEMWIPDHLTCLFRNLYAGQEATVRLGHGTIDWFQIGKGVRQGCLLSLCLFNFYAEYIMRNAGLEEAQTGIKTAWRNINNFRYADDTTNGRKWRGTKELLMKLKEKSEKAGLKLNIEKTKIMVPSLRGK